MGNSGREGGVTLHFIEENVFFKFRGGGGGGTNCDKISFGFLYYIVLYMFVFVFCVLYEMVWGLITIWRMFLTLRFINLFLFHQNLGYHHIYII